MTKDILYPDFATAYRDILLNIMNRGEERKARGFLAKEIRNFSISINGAGGNLFKNEVRSPDLRYLCGELAWYFAGMNDLDFISKYSKFWNKISDNGHSCNSAYGYLLFRDPDIGRGPMTQWAWALESLINDKDTRQAVIHFNRTRHQIFGVKDFPCTMYGVFSIRYDPMFKKNVLESDYVLDFSVFMRSSDSILGTTYDIPFFMLLQQQMAINVSKISFINNPMRLGDFYYHTNSQHIYERDFELAKKMLKHNFYKDSTPPIGYSLINSENGGLPSMNMVDLYYSIKNGEKRDYTDPFMKYVYENAIKEKSS